MKKKCTIDNCNKLQYARGWCRNHYRHVVEGGHSEPLKVPPAMCTCGKELPNKTVSVKNSFLCRECYYTKWLSEHQEEQKLWKKEYRIKNKDKINKNCQEWRNKNRDKENAYYAKKRKDPLYRLVHNLRSRLYDFLAGRIKHKNTESLTGCSFKELQKHLESKFKPGMTWDNYGSYWSVDHKEPYSSISSDDIIGIERISHYTNLQPLTIEENCSKATQDKLCKKN
jgi:hypothetical protein